MNEHRQDDLRITERAADWLIAMDENPGNQEPFAEWIGQSARHIEEFLFTSAVRQEFRGWLRRHPVDVEALLASARTGESANIVPLAVTNDSFLSPGQRVLSRRVFAAACVAVMVAIAAWAVTAHEGWLRMYSTDVGEQRSLGLPDGSVVFMNALSRVKVDYSAAAREVKLLEGEALFRVAPEPGRPFQVRAGHAVIHAIGTQFNVNRRDRNTTVSVIEGAVRISRNDSAPAPGAGSLGSGQEAQVTAEGRVTASAPVDIALIGAWRQRRLVFVEERLADVAAEFNRYNPTPLIEVRDAAARNTRLSGVFDADDPESMLLFVEELTGLSLDRTGDRIIVRSNE
jgi:transmembrane sensor